MALVGVELETLVSEPDALTTYLYFSQIVSFKCKPMQAINFLNS